MPGPFFLRIRAVSDIVTGHRWISSNAVNLTALDLWTAIGCTVIASCCPDRALTYVVGHEKFSSYLDIQNIPGCRK
jgi:hypothetical protein